jgi:FKBP-type peptidyl-prolyl cis-trans isomerase 2
MQRAKIGSQVKIHYSIRIAGGKTVGTSKGGLPLTFTVGDGKVLKGLDQGIVDMQVGQRKTICINPEEAYGLRNEQLVLRLKKEELPEDLTLEAGRPIQYQTPEGERVNLMVLEVEENTVLLDGNHPLAGQALEYEVELVALS